MGLLGMELILMRKEMKKIGENVAITPNSYRIIFKCNLVREHITISDIWYYYFL